MINTQPCNYNQTDGLWLLREGLPHQILRTLFDQLNKHIEIKAIDQVDEYMVVVYTGSFTRSVRQGLDKELER